VEALTIGHVAAAAFADGSQALLKRERSFKFVIPDHLPMNLPDGFPLHILARRLHFGCHQLAGLGEKARSKVALKFYRPKNIDGP
jgi:hypothetical protein